MARRNVVTDYLNEVIAYGPLALRRCDVFGVVMEDTGSRFAADLFAFGPNRRVVDCEPLTIAEYRAEMAAIEAECAA